MFPPEQLFAVMPSFSRKDALCPEGFAASFHEKSKPIFTPLGPASVAEIFCVPIPRLVPRRTRTVQALAIRCLFIFMFGVLRSMYFKFDQGKLWRYLHGPMGCCARQSV